MTAVSINIQVPAPMPACAPSLDFAPTATPAPEPSKKAAAPKRAPWTGSNHPIDAVTPDSFPAWCDCCGVMLSTPESLKIHRSTPRHIRHRRTGKHVEQKQLPNAPAAPSAVPTVATPPAAPAMPAIPAPPTAADIHPRFQQPAAVSVAQAPRAVQPQLIPVMLLPNGTVAPLQAVHAMPVPFGVPAGVPMLQQPMLVHPFPQQLQMATAPPPAQPVLLSKAALAAKATTSPSSSFRSSASSASSSLEVASSTATSSFICANGGSFLPPGIIARSAAH